MLAPDTVTSYNDGAGKEGGSLTRPRQEGETMRQTQVRVQDRRRVYIDRAETIRTNAAEVTRRKVREAVQAARQFAGPDYRRGAETWGYI